MYTFPIWLQLIALALPALTGVSVCRALVRRHPDITVDTALPRLRHIWLLLAASFSIVLAVYFVVRLPIGQQAALPIWLVEAAPVVLWTTISSTFAYLFALTVTLARRSGHPQWRQLALAAVLGLAAILVAQHRITVPLWPTMSDDGYTSTDGSILQTTDDTCAAAAGANVARALGLHLTERQLARAMHTTMLGTTTAQIIRGMRDSGINCTPFQVPPARPDLAPTPAILFVHLPDDSIDAHAIALLHANPVSTEAVDPLYGHYFQNTADWAGSWGGRGVSCVLSTEE